MRKTFGLLFLLSVFSAACFGQSHRLFQEIMDARKKGKTASVEQCTADLRAWQAAADSDAAAQGNGDTSSWTDTVSTLELERMESEASTCPRILKKAHKYSSDTLIDFWMFGWQFRSVLCDRAKSVLYDHGLLSEYLSENGVLPSGKN